MPMADKEFVLNYATNRWQLNFKRNVGPTSDSIRLCAPETIEEWADYYYNNIRSIEQIDNLGRILYDKIANVLPGERRYHPALLESISESDCIDYIHGLVITKTFNGYMKENGR